MTQPTPDQTGPYSQAASKYRILGWSDVLPLPSGQKSHPPTGFTGKRFAHISPTDAQIADWIAQRPRGNVALRMPANVLGVDVDAYGDKTGAESFAAAQAKMGPLPDTWRVTSRDDGVSGIRFYRIPEGLAWPNQVGPGIETIHRGHRYAVVWPSLHPEGRQYRWIGPDNMPMIGPGPSPDDLPELPAAWVIGLTQGQIEKPAAERSDSNPEEIAIALADWCTPGSPCGLVNRKVYEIDQALHGRSGSRHDAVRDLTLALLRLGQVGHNGVAWALQHTQDGFIEAVGEDRGTTSAELEWRRMLVGGVQIVLASMRPEEPCRGADCDGKIPSLEFDLDGFLSQDATSDLPEALLDAPISDDDPSIYADLSWLLTGERPVIEPPEWVTRSDGTSLFYTGRINGVFGDPETAKSWLAMCAVAEALQSGHRCVYLDVDHNGSGEIAQRLILLGAPVEAVADPDLFRIAEPEDVLGLKSFVHDMLAWKPVIAVVDSLGEIVPMLGLKSTDNDDITKAIRAICKPLAHVAGACVITIDHLPKGTESRESGYAIGGTAKKRAVDGSYLSASVILAPAPGKLGKISLSIEKDRNGQLRETSPGKHAGTFILDSTEAGKTAWRIEMPSMSEDGRMRPTVLMQRVSQFVREWPGEQLPGRMEIIEGVKGKTAAVRLALDMLIEEGFLIEIKDSDKHNAPRRYQSIKVYWDDQNSHPQASADGFSQPGQAAPTHRPCTDPAAPGHPAECPNCAGIPPTRPSLEGRSRVSTILGSEPSKEDAAVLSKRDCSKCGAALSVSQLMTGATKCDRCQK